MEQLIDKFGIGGIVLYLLIKELWAYRDRRRNSDNKKNNPGNDIHEFREATKERLTKLETEMEDARTDIKRIEKKVDNVSLR